MDDDRIDFKEPTITTKYFDVLSFLRGNIKAIATGNYRTGAPPLDAIRAYNSRIQRYDGNGWVDAAAIWEIVARTISDGDKTIRGKHHFPDGITVGGVDTDPGLPDDETPVGSGYSMVDNPDGTPTAGEDSSQLNIAFAPGLPVTNAFSNGGWGIIGPTTTSSSEMTQSWGALNSLSSSHKWARIYIDMAYLFSTYAGDAPFFYTYFRRPNSGFKSLGLTESTRRGGFSLIGGESGYFQTWTGEVTVPVLNQKIGFAYFSNILSGTRTIKMNLVGYGI